MATNRNALAELAEEMQVDVRIMYVHGKMRDRMKKAQRIVAELAKVEFYERLDRKIMASPEESSYAVGKCRAIAEEGAGDVP